MAPHPLLPRNPLLLPDSRVTNANQPHPPPNHPSPPSLQNARSGPITITLTAPGVPFHTNHSSPVPAAQSRLIHRAFTLPALSLTRHRGDAWHAPTGARNPPLTKPRRHSLPPRPAAPAGSVNHALSTTSPTRTPPGSVDVKASLNLNSANSTESGHTPSSYPRRLTQTLNSPPDASTISPQQK